MEGEGSGEGEEEEVGKGSRGRNKKGVIMVWRLRKWRNDDGVVVYMCRAGRK